MSTKIKNDTEVNLDVVFKLFKYKKCQKLRKRLL